MTRLRRVHLVPLAVLALAVGLPAAAAAPAAAATTTYTITDLGSLGSGGTQPTGINASGQVTGDSLTSAIITVPCPTRYNPRRTCSSHPKHAFVYSNGTMTDLGTLNDVYSHGNSINVSGEVAGYASKPGPSIGGGPMDQDDGGRPGRARPAFLRVMEHRERDQRLRPGDRLLGHLGRPDQYRRAPLAGLTYSVKMTSTGAVIFAAQAPTWTDGSWALVARRGDPCPAGQTCSLTVTDSLGSSVTASLAPPKY